MGAHSSAWELGVGHRWSVREGVCVYSSRRRHTSCSRDWSSGVCSSDLVGALELQPGDRELSPGRLECLLEGAQLPDQRGRRERRRLVVGSGASSPTADAAHNQSAKENEPSLQHQFLGCRVHSPLLYGQAVPILAPPHQFPVNQPSRAATPPACHPSSRAIEPFRSPSPGPPPSSCRKPSAGRPIPP